MAGWCSSPVRRASGSQRWSSRCSATCPRRELVLGGVRRAVHPAAARPAVRHRGQARRRAAGTVPGGRAPGRTCSARCCARSASQASCGSWSWRTSTGRTRPPSTCCASWAGASGTRTCCSSSPTGTRVWAPPIRSASPSAIWPPNGRSGGSGSPRSRRTRCGCWRARPGLDAAALYRLTGGNPFYVTEVVQSGMGEVPTSARDAVLARVSRLGRRRPRGAGRRRADRYPGRAPAAGDGHWLPARRRRRAPRLRAAGRGRRGG